MRRALVIVVLASAGCASSPSSSPSPIDQAASAISPSARSCVDLAVGPAAVARRVEIDVADGVGLSGLDVEGGRLVIVPERRPRIFLHDLASGETRSLPLSGVPAQVDVESVAVLGPGALVLGTEAAGERTTEDLLLVQVDTERAVVAGRVSVASGEDGLAFADNAGFEGLCAAGGRVFAAVETVHELEGRRYASILSVATEALDDGAVLVPTLHRIALSSETGKLSALTCRAGADGTVSALAIERHFGVARLVRFELGREQRVDAEVVADLVPLFAHDENFEGLACAGDELVLVNDNDYGGPTGPSELVVIEPARRSP